MNISVRSACHKNLKNIDLDLPAGKLTVIQGPSGSGKSALLDLFLGESAYRTALIERVESLSAKDPLPSRPASAAIENLPKVVQLDSLSTLTADKLLLHLFFKPEQLFRYFVSEGVFPCPCCSSISVQSSIETHSTESVALLIEQQFSGKLITVAALAADENPLKAQDLLRLGYNSILLHGKHTFLEELEADAPLHTAPHIVLDTLSIGSRNSLRLRESLTSSAVLNPRAIAIWRADENRAEIEMLATYPLGLACSTCDYRPDPLTVDDFNPPSGVPPKKVVSTLMHGMLSLNEVMARPIGSFAALDSGSDSEFIQILRKISTACLLLNVEALSLGSTTDSLSSSEFYRMVVIANSLCARPATMFLLDQPGSVLGGAALDGLIKLLHSLRVSSHTLLVADNSTELAARADRLLRLGPGSGFEGGVLMFSGLPPPLGPRNLAPAPRAAEPQLHKLNCLSPPSGTAASGLSISEKYSAQFHRVLKVAADRYGKRARGDVAAVISLADPLRDFFAALEDSRLHGLTSASFRRSTATKEFSAAALEIRYKGFSMADIVKMTIKEALGWLQNIPRCAAALHGADRLGLGHLNLSGSVADLSSGEYLRLLLAKAASSGAPQALYLLERPCRSLDDDQVVMLVDVLRSMIAGGATIVAEEHNPMFISLCDYQIQSFLN